MTPAASWHQPQRVLLAALALALVVAAPRGTAAGDPSGGGRQLANFVTFHDSAGSPINLRRKTWEHIVESTPLKPFDLSPAQAMQQERQVPRRRPRSRNTTAHRNRAGAPGHGLAVD